MRLTKSVLQKKRAGELRKESAGFPVGLGGGAGEENLENLELNRLEATTVSHLLSIKKKNALSGKMIQTQPQDTHKPKGMLRSLNGLK